MPAEYLKIGFTFADYDKAMRFTWKFLRNATAGQVHHSIARIFKADNRSTNGLVLNRLFSPVEDNNEWQHRVLGLWNGTLGLVPPSYMGNTFDTSTTHDFASQAAVIDSGDVEDMIRAVTRKGYGLRPGSNCLFWRTPPRANRSSRGVRERRAGRAAGSPSTTSSSPPMPRRICRGGECPRCDPARRIRWFQGAGVIWKSWLIESNYIPSGYVAVVASGGPGSPDNPVAVREQPNAQYCGLRAIPGKGPYPLQESFAARGIGVGVPHRGAAAVTQVTTGSAYTDAHGVGLTLSQFTPPNAEHRRQG